VSDGRAGVSRAGYILGVRTHLRWIIPLGLALLVYIACAWGVQALAVPASTHVETALFGWGLAIVGLIGPITLVIIAIAQAVGIYKRSRHRRGHFSRTELAQIGERRAQANAWNSARAFRLMLLRNEVPPSLEQWNVPAHAGERFFASAPMTYARYYGQDVQYSSGGGFAFGHPAFVVGAMAVSSTANSISRSNARAQAAQQWREWQIAHVLISNQRLVVNAAGQWMSFPYDAMTAVYPEVAAQTLVCQFSDTSPLLLQGPHTPIAAIMTTFATHGRDGLERHPSLLPLD
jgi:hypothetical protein